MALIEFKAELALVVHELRRIADALDRALPSVVQEPPKGLAPSDVIHGDSATVWKKKQKAQIEERLRRVSQSEPTPGLPKVKTPSPPTK